MKQVIQLDENGYFAGLTVADESPLEPGVFLMPAMTVDASAPSVPEGHRAKWNGSGFDFEVIPEPAPEPQPAEKTYAQKRADEYPSMGDQLDALFKAGAFPTDMAAKIQAIKDKYPKV